MMKKRLAVVLFLAAAVFPITSGAYAGYYADAIHEWAPGNGAWPQSPGNVLGPPDFDVVNDAYGIGRGGVLTLKISAPFTDGPGMDLTVFEYGASAGGTGDSYDVSVADETQAYQSVGSSTGGATSFDLASVGFGPFRYVRITDTDSTGQFDGADIDAVEVTTVANFAKSIQQWGPGDGTWPESPGDVLGPPDFDVVNDAYGIGRGGVIVLEMERPFFDQAGDDLKVFEYGSCVGGTDDSFDVSISTDGQSFFAIGSSSGDHTMFDVASVGSPGPFRYVRITDTDSTGQFDGADIDAVQAFTPEPATLSLLALGGVAVLFRRRR